MKLVAAKCPNCGAKIKVDINKKVYTCEFCRYDILLDDGTGLSDVKANVAGIHDQFSLNKEELLARQKQMQKFMFIPFIVVGLIAIIMFAAIIPRVMSEFSNDAVVNNESESFNRRIEDVGLIYSGFITELLNNVITNITTTDREIIVVYNDTEYKSASEIMDASSQISELRKELSVLNKKDNDGFINKIIIEEVE